MQHARRSISAWSLGMMFGIATALCGCVEPPTSAPPPPPEPSLCEDTGRETVCQNVAEGDERDFNACCTGINDPLVWQRRETLIEPTKFDSFVQQCLMAFRNQNPRQISCIKLIKDIKEPQNWDFLRIVRECQSLFLGSGLDELDRISSTESCINRLANPTFTPSFSHDPVALIYACHRPDLEAPGTDFKANRSSYAKDCIEILGSMQSFPFTGANAALANSRSEADWKRIAVTESLPALCRQYRLDITAPLLVSPVLYCPIDSAKQCLESFANFNPSEDFLFDKLTTFFHSRECYLSNERVSDRLYLIPSPPQNSCTIQTTPDISGSGLNPCP